MSSRKYTVSAKANSVDAHWESAHHSIPVRVFGSLAMAAFAAAWMYLFIFRVGEGNTWWVFAHERLSSRDFIEAAIETLLNSAIVSFFLAIVVRTLFPAGEKLHVDRSELIVSKIPWVSFRGQWTTRVFSLSEVSEMEYGILQRGTAKNPSVYGIRFVANGKLQKILSRIEPPEASHLLRGLKRLGADVRHDPDMFAKIQETLGDRREMI